MSSATAVSIHPTPSRRGISPTRRHAVVPRRSGRRPGSSGELPDRVTPETLDGRVFGVLVELERQGPGFLAELLTEFREGVERKVRALEDAVRVGDADALAFAAHGLRGSCGTVGAVRMAALATELEDHTPASAEDRWALVGWIEAEYGLVGKALDQEMA